MNRLSELRALRGMTQQQLSEKSGVHRVAIARLEAGKRQIESVSFSTALALAAALDVDPRDLINRE